MHPTKQSCPCGSNRPFLKCCGNKKGKNDSNSGLVQLPNGQRLPMPQVMQGAIASQMAGQPQHAAELYRLILASNPRQADALHLLGLAEHQLGHNSRAAELIQAAIAINSKTAIFHSNLGRVFRSLGEADRAVNACRHAIRLDSTLPEAYYNLGEALQLQGATRAARAAYNQALTLRPTYADVFIGLGDLLLQENEYGKALANYLNAVKIHPESIAVLTRIGTTLRKQGNVQSAIEHYEQAIRRCPNAPVLYNNIALIYQSIGRLEDAATNLRELLKLTPNDASAKHLLHAVEGSTTEHAPPQYVRDIFDGYAGIFEEHLVNKLNYKIPELLAQKIRTCVGRQRSLSALDLGCGTGLVGKALRDQCSHLVGVDLSPKMIDKARMKGLYTDLAIADIHKFMQAGNAGSYDLIVAADVFIYVGDLRLVFSHSYRLLRPGGLLAFSVEKTCDCDMGFILDHTGRYCHSRPYLQKLGDEFGFSEAHLSETCIRIQNNKPVDGYICIYKAPD